MLCSEQTWGDPPGPSEPMSSLVARIEHLSCTVNMRIQLRYVGYVPGGPLVRKPPCNAGHVLAPGWGMKIPHASEQSPRAASD